MRVPMAAVLISFAAINCSGVDDPPLGGPFGGTTNQTDPSGGGNPVNPTDPGTGTDSDSGTPPTQTKDAGTQTQGSGTQTNDSGTQTQNPGPTAPTWTQIFNSYLASSTTGQCSACHSHGSSASNLYSWLQSKGYISGKSSALVDPNQSCLSWFGGNMPPNGPASYGNAISDMNAWAAAGAPNN